MPPRYAYWTIIVDGQPTAFRSGSMEDIMPTFNRLKEKQPSAELKWFQNGQLWASRHDAQESTRARGDRGRTRDARETKSDDSDVAAGSSRAERPERAWNAKPEWKTRSTFKPRDRDPGSETRAPRNDDKPAWVPKDKGARPESGSRTPGPGSFDRPSGQARSDRKPEWKPKGTFKPREPGHASGWDEKPGWKPKDKGRDPGSGIRDPRTDDKPAWKPKGKSSFPPDPGSRTPAPGGKPAWKPKGDEGGKPAWRPKPGGSARDQARSSFKPKSYTPKTDDGMTRSSRVQSKNDKLEWKPASARASARQAPDSRPKGPNAGFSRGAASDSPASDGPKRKWVPKAEYKKSLGIEPKKDSKWRPGGDHVDPKQKYKDAKKAKWGRFKEAIRSRSAKPRKRNDD